MSVIIKLRDFDSEFNPNFQVTNHEMISSDNNFTKDGVFSEVIFGNSSSFNEYLCQCGETTGAYMEGIKCKKCNTPVRINYLTLEKEGWIDLGDKFINPFLYPYLASAIGPTNLKKILDFHPEIEENGILKEVDISYPYFGIGHSNFIANIDKILAEYFHKRKKHEYKFSTILNNIEKLIITKYPVKNKRLRPAMVSGKGEITFDVNNTFYNNIISNSNTLKSLSVFERSPINSEKLKSTIQENINLLHKSTIQNLNSKYGYIRSSLIGNRMDYCSRMVITPLNEDYGIDDIVLPYNTSVELLRPLIINKLSQVVGMNLIKANRYLKKSHRVFSPLIYSIMKDIIKSDNVGIIINRNPSINIGSMIFLRIKDIKTDLLDLTSSIHNLILKPLNGDYDGDVINHFIVFGKENCNLFNKFAPSNLLVDCSTGLFNRDFLPDKDTSLGLYTLFV